MRCIRKYHIPKCLVSLVLSVLSYKLSINTLSSMLYTRKKIVQHYLMVMFLYYYKRVGFYCVVNLEHYITIY